MTAVLQMVQVPGEFEVPLTRIRPFSGQPRTYFDPKRIRGLAVSIRAVGLLLPLLVKPIKDDPKHDYELIDGERRHRACTLEQLESVRVVIGKKRGELDKYEQLVMSVVANLCREELSHIEQARACAMLRERHSVQEIADMMGLEATGWVYQLLAILKLPKEVQDLMEPSIPRDDRLNMTVAHYITQRVPEDKPKIAIAMAKQIVGDRMRVSQAKLLIDKKSDGLGKEQKHYQIKPGKRFDRFSNFILYMERNLEVWLGTANQEFVEMVATRSPREMEFLVKGLGLTTQRIERLIKRIATARTK